MTTKSRNADLMKSYCHALPSCELVSPKRGFNALPLPPVSLLGHGRAHRLVNLVAVFSDSRPTISCTSTNVRPPRPIAPSSARDARIQHLIWQAPDHEAVLLRHLEGCANRQPPAGQSRTALRREWDDYYEKGVSALGARIGIEDIRRACAVEAELNAFLRAIGCCSYAAGKMGGAHGTASHRTDYYQQSGRAIEPAADVTPWLIRRRVARVA